MKQLIWLEDQTVLAEAIHTLDRDEGPGGAAAGSWSLGVWRDPRAGETCGCGSGGDVREEVMVGTVEEAGQPWKQG